MDRWIKIFTFVTFMIGTGWAVMFLSASKPEVHEAVLVAQNETVCEELPIVDPVDIPEYETSWSDMVKETIQVWEQFFDMENAKMNDWRRNNFEQFAEYVADATITYQTMDADIGGRLPRHRNTHLILATVITKEASVNEKVVGLRGEVGLMQVMPGGPVMANLDPKFVAKKPKLGVLLGARWLAHAVKVCYPDGMPDEWTDDMWVGVLSAYATRHPLSKRTGKCKRFQKSKERVALMTMYRTWMDGESLRD